MIFYLVALEKQKKYFHYVSSVRSDLMDDGANSTLSIAKVGKLDSGNYTCSIGPNDFYTITVHILHGKFSFCCKSYEKKKKQIQKKKNY